MEITLSPQVIPSILDNDFYKFTMQHAVVKQFPYAKAAYIFINRGQHKYPPGFAEALRAAVDEMAKLKLTKQEKAFLQVTCPYLDPTYLDFLQGYHFDPSEVEITQEGEDLEVAIKGYWYRTILWEVPLMSMICELYYKLTGSVRESDDIIRAKTKEKIENYKKLGITIAEFGTRRRHSYTVHQVVVETLQQYGGGTFIGTSNVHLAMKYGTKPIGTHAHEWFMFHAAKYGFKMANSMGLEHWVDTYRGDLGIALTDTYTSKVFFESFDKKFAKLFDGVRHDSGDAIEFANQTIAHYKKMNIDPLSKTIIFSDGLNPEKVERIATYCKNRIGMSFGIGTDFTNDAGLPALNIVIKMTQAYPEGGPWTDVVKLSDEPKKHTGTPEMIDLAQRLLDIPTA
ncbi:nicotinate phosphoribosyltransferase [Myroides sp. 1354]|uniref:nicotinate phosphoribosyltransferase n=1 Tax=unclassified Myroides TaxID=2642485 RepID=UPI00257511D1|nr:MULTISPECIES: nicotinate phosphoribosyltransferase [unclassified Myroides]MDM1045089.1 nicotinate phosphoribosyltransferase [Myroides sp. R163-1]MDM1055971.1 nicotinate phosphoribosyltransferase [Myroides sp. 1354]MDM1069080.1 nicotinate phosphoribosyltransferase [Myroides sp. 1372]